MRTTRSLRSWDDASFEDRLKAADGRAVIELLGSIRGGKHRDTILTRSHLGFVSIQIAVPRGCEEIVGLFVADQSLVVALGNADADREQVLSNGLLHWDVNAQQSDAALLVSLCCPEQLSDSPSPLAAVVEPVKQLVNIGPTPFVKDQAMLLQLVAT